MMNPALFSVLLAGLGTGEALEPSYSLTSELAAPVTSELAAPIALTGPVTYSLVAGDDDGSAFSYTYLELGGATFDVDAVSEEADIYYLNASLALGIFYLMAGYENQDIDFMSTEGDLLTLGFGMHFSLTEKLDVAADLAWLYSDVSSGLPALDDTESGYQFRIIPRWMVVDWDRGGLELNAMASWIDLDNRIASEDSAFGYGVGARGHFLSLMSVGLNWQALEDDERVSFDLRISL